jgi:hypothetical protein
MSVADIPFGPKNDNEVSIYATTALRADSAGQVLVSASRHLIARSEKIYFLLMTLFALSSFPFSAFQLPKTPTTEESAVRSRT